MVFALGNARVPHSFFFFILAMDAFFLLIEARRWSLFSYSRARVLMLERGFYGRALLGEVDTDPAATPDPGHDATTWKHGLKVLLLAPTQHIERVCAHCVF